MIFLDKDELKAFEGQIEDMLNYSADSKNIEEALKENIYHKANDVFNEMENL